MSTKTYNVILRIAILIVFAFALGILLAVVQNIFNFELSPLYRMIIAVVFILTFMVFLSKRLK